MQQPDTTNTMFQLATELVCGTNANIFLTGKAGTGKTTFLKHIKELTQKTLAVVAPTGVAAINAGGTTIHSFFQLPFTPFVPTAGALSSDTLDPHALIARMKLTTERRQVLRQLELLIIDEISMVRADTLDAIDLLLRHFRYRHQEPFGGVQVLMIGDMYQIPPVIRQEEWRLLSQFYKSGYFFDSRVMEAAPPVHLAFTKIYRQQDERFVQLLNGIRNNNLDAQGLRLLQSLYKPNYPLDQNDSIILTTHNAKADEINASRMARLRTRPHFFEAAVEGDFSDKAFPADQQLQLKVGAQVMFIKNDVEKVRRYYNGKIGTVSRIEDDKIFVSSEGEDEIEVKKEKWENIRYGIDATSQQVEEDVIGSFTQFPLRLAWAVTIHKSQGLTFDKVIIDAGAAFSPGQVYVALSRCTSLAGVTLLSEIAPHSLLNDKRVVQFSSLEHPVSEIEELLHRARHQYQAGLIHTIFDVTPLVKDFHALRTLVAENSTAFNEALGEAVSQLVDNMETLEGVAQRFTIQRGQLLLEDTYPEENASLQARISSAAVYFTNQLNALQEGLSALGAVTESRQLAKSYNDLYRQIFVNAAQKKSLIQSTITGFSVTRFYAAKAKFVAPTPSVNAYAAGGDGQTPPAAAHPALHRKLRQLRDAICEESGQPIYLVASGKTLDELTQYLPQNLEELKWAATVLSAMLRLRAICEIGKPSLYKARDCSALETFFSATGPFFFSATGSLRTRFLDFPSMLDSKSCSAQ